MNDPRITFTSGLGAGNAADIYSLLGGTAIRISASTRTIESFSGQILVYQLASLLGRLFDNVILGGDENIPAHPKLSMVSGKFIPFIRNLLPTLRPIQATPPSNTIRVVLGEMPDMQGDIYLGATGWSAKYSRIKCQSIDDSDNPVGALAAGTIGAAEVFKLVFDGKLKGAAKKDEYALCLLDYHTKLPDAEPSLPSDISLDAVLFGCGSIGCAAAANILLTPSLNGQLTLVDNGKFDQKNPYKYPFLDWESARSGAFKVHWLEQQFEQFTEGRIRVNAFKGIARDYVAALSVEYKIPLAISAVDTFEARAEIQDTLPRRIINAGISGTFAEVSIHGFGKGPCLACLTLQHDRESWKAKPIADATGLSEERAYTLIRENSELSPEDIATIRAAKRIRSDVLADADSYIGQPLLSLVNRALYSEALVTRNDQSPIQVTTAFVSAFAGVLILAELLKELVPSLTQYRVQNSYRQELLGVPAEGVFQYERDPKGWCLCHSYFREQVYVEKYGALE